MNKQECEKELENSLLFTVSIVNQDGWTEFESEFEKTTVYECFKQLIKEHFELVEKYNQIKGFKEYFDELYGQGLEVANWHLNGDLEPLDEFIEDALDYFNNEIKPYKFEDLKPNLWVWDNVDKFFKKIYAKYKNNRFGYTYLETDYEYGGFKELFDTVIFEENRFFPITKANEVLG